MNKLLKFIILTTVFTFLVTLFMVININASVLFPKRNFILISEITVPANTTTITFDNLNILSHKQYYLSMSIINPQTSESYYYLYYNNDTTLANYNTQSLKGSGNSTIARRASNPSIAHIRATSYAQFNIFIDLTNQRVMAFTTASMFVSPNTITCSSSQIRHATALTNITRLDISSVLANAIGAGSVFRLYRIN